MIMLRKTHEAIMGAKEELIDDLDHKILIKCREIDNLKIKMTMKNNLIEDLTNKNCNLNTKLVGKDAQLSKIVKRNEGLGRVVEDLREDNQELKDIRDLYDDANKSLLAENDELKKKVKDLQEDNTKFMKLWNDANRTAWCNEESKRQLRKIAIELRESDSYKKNELANYLDDMSMRMGGGVPYEIKFKEEE